MSELSDNHAPANFPNTVDLVLADVAAAQHS
jgi:hypothetical protein